MADKRRFGRVRRLPSGRWQARYRGPDGIDRPAPHTFAAKADAARWLTLTEAEIVRGEWLNPDRGRVPFADYATAWVTERPGLRPKTMQLYEGLVRLHLCPVLGLLPVQAITESHVRKWRKTLLDSGVGEVTVAKAYRLLKAILNTAVDDGMIRRNPCRIKGAGQDAVQASTETTCHGFGLPHPKPFSAAFAFEGRVWLQVGAQRWDIARIHHVQQVEESARTARYRLEFRDGSAVSVVVRFPAEVALWRVLDPTHDEIDSWSEDIIKMLPYTAADGWTSGGSDDIASWAARVLPLWSTGLRPDGRPIAQ